MAALSVSNLEQFNRQESTTTTVPRIKRKQSVASRRSSHSSSTGAVGAERWRRLSRGYSISMYGGSHRNLRSAIETPQLKPSSKFENTYRMTPDEGCKFNPGPVETIIQMALETNLSGSRYEPRTSAVFAQRISEEIKQRVKELKLPRYKIVSQVYIGADEGQSVHMVSRAVWDTSTDNYATASFKNKSLYAVGAVHAVYFE
ncbi:Tctex1 domain-containing protein 4 [Holothuria leucospilota]|uniref:Tctex1 domain-containing protein 4 n=1 Tax=Holothuria leucospilota TaxID=206669 RepID=A0A9Q1H971_HOLLE|nr:Tctex1 domain-containing protein 4 [Holothuria leucospilota]